MLNVKLAVRIATTGL